MVEDADGAGSADDGRRGESGAHFSAVNQSGTIDNQNNNRSSSSRSNDDAEAAGGDGAGVGKDKEAGVSRPSKRPRDNAHQQVCLWHSMCTFMCMWLALLWYVVRQE